MHDRQMLTGKHRVKDIRCIECNILIGWKYVFRGHYCNDNVNNQYRNLHTKKTKSIKKESS